MITIGRQKHQNKEVMRYEKSNMPVLRFMQQPGNCCCEIIPTVRSTPRVSEDNMSRFTRLDDLCSMLEQRISKFQHENKEKK